jgi:hypothetical protein
MTANKKFEVSPNLKKELKEKYDDLSIGIKG